MAEFFNRSRETQRRRRLRKAMPTAEVILWSRLQGRQVVGKKFRRQYSVGPYFIDFYCVEVRLAVELDGDTHFTSEARSYDRERQQFIESFGIRFLRFTNVDVYENLDGVLEVIAGAISGDHGCRAAGQEPRS